MKKLTQITTVSFCGAVLEYSHSQGNKTETDVRGDINEIPFERRKPSS